MTFSYPRDLMHKWVAIDAGESGGTLAHICGVETQNTKGLDSAVSKIRLTTNILVVSTFGTVRVFREARSVELNGRYPYKVYETVEEMKDDIFIDSLKLNRDSTVMLARHIPELAKVLRSEE